LSPISPQCHQNIPLTKILPSLFLTAWAIFGSDGEENIEFCCCPVRGTNPLGPGSRGSRWFNELIELGRCPHGGESRGFDSRIVNLNFGAG